MELQSPLFLHCIYDNSVYISFLGFFSSVVALQTQNPQSSSVISGKVKFANVMVDKLIPTAKV